MPPNSDGGGARATAVSHSPRVLIAIYGAAFFSLGSVPMAAIIVSLWALQIGVSPLWIGIAISTRALLPMLLSIHGGALMDRLGTRRVTLAFSVVTLATFPLYPLLPWLPALLVLQLVSGFTQGLTWVGGQTLYGQLTRGSVKHAGRVTLFTNGGLFAAPLLAGLAWDHVGVVGAFGLLTLWSFAVFVLMLLLPREIDPPPRRVALGELLPRGSDYLRAIALCAIPVVALVMIFTFLRIALFGMQTSFYIIYLETIGLSASLIGILMASANLISGPAALINLPPRIIKPVWLMIVTTGLGIVFMAATPLLPGFWALLAAAALYGISAGLCFPTLLSLLSGAVDPATQGISVGLRTTVNRVASLVVPIVMGAVAEVSNLTVSFLVVGGFCLVAVILTALFVWRNPNAYS